MTTRNSRLINLSKDVDLLQTPEEISTFLNKISGDNIHTIHKFLRQILWQNKHTLDDENIKQSQNYIQQIIVTKNPVATKQSTIESMPQKIFTTIGQLLSFQDKIKLSKTNTTYFSKTNDAALWVHHKKLKINNSQLQQIVDTIFKY